MVQSKVDGPEIQKWRYLGMKAEEIHTFEQEIVIFILQLYLHRVYHNQSDVDSNEKDRIRFSPKTYNFPKRPYTFSRDRVLYK